MCLDDHKRVLTLGSDSDLTELKLRVKELFANVLKDAPSSDFFLQLKDTSWGEWVDIIDQSIPDRSLLRLELVPQVYTCASIKKSH